MRAKKPYPCSMCNNSRVSERNGVCSACDALLIENERQFLAEIESRAPKRHCRECGARLESNRYFQCEECLEPAEMPSEDIYIERADSTEIRGFSRECHDKTKGKRDSDWRRFGEFVNRDEGETL